MRLLERTLEKITSLLRVGFGEAGAGIIRANLNMQGKIREGKGRIQGQCSESGVKEVEKKFLERNRKDRP